MVPNPAEMSRWSSITGAQLKPASSWHELFSLHSVQWKTRIRALRRREEHKKMDAMIRSGVFIGKGRGYTLQLLL